MDRELLEAQAKECLERAKYFKDDCQFRLAIEAGEKAAELYLQLQMWEQCIDVRQLIGGILYAVCIKRSSIFDYLEETLQLAQKHLDKNHLLFATIFYHFGNEYEKIKRPKLAKEYYHKSLKIRKIIEGEASFHVGVLYGYIGRNHYMQNDYYSSTTNFEKGLSILSNVKDNSTQQVEVDKSKAQVHFMYGSMLHSFEPHEKALFHLNKALDIVLKIGRSEKILIASIYRETGGVYSHIGEYTKALLLYKKALHEWELMFGEGHYLTAEIKVSIGSLLVSMRAEEEAIKCLEEAVAICENSLEVNGEQLGYAYTQFHRIYQNKGDHDQAFGYIKKSLDINTQLFGKESIHVASNEYSIGGIYKHKREYEKALKYYRQSLKKSMAFGKAYYVVTAYNYHGIGRVLAIQHKYQAALESIQKSIQTFCPNFLESDIYQNPKLQDISFFAYIWSVFIYKAELFFAYYQHETQIIRDYEAALANYQLVDELVYRFRKSYHSTDSMLALVARNVMRSYSKGIYTAFQAPPSLDKRAFAFRFSEKAKATILHTSLQESIAKVSANIPAELLQKEKNLKVELTYLDKSIEGQKARAKDRNRELLQKLQNKYFILNQEYTQVIQSFEQDYPDYYQLKYQTETASIEEIQANLRGNQWMVSYFIGEDRYYIFLIGKEEFEVLDLEKISSFEALVEDFLSAIQNHKLEEYAQKGYELYQELLQPLEMYLIDPSIEEVETVQQLIIIPHGILHYLPFEALVCSRAKNSGKVYVVNEQEENTTNPYQSLDYALLHFEVSYHYSATLWHYLLSKQGERAPKDVNNFVGFAPVYENTLLTNELEMGREKNEKVEIEKAWTLAANEMQTWASRSKALRGDGTWIPLPHSKTEAQNIAALFEKKGLPTQTFLHEQATKRQFREVVESSRFLLIATHGVVNDKHPKLSGLVFYPERWEEGDERQDVVDKTLVPPSRFSLPSSQTDCILSMEETYHLNLQADLVVLSSCESGIGTLAEGEGMMAVNRGFLYAGARNVVSTLFKVYDEPSSFLTQYLFEGVLEGMNYAAALRKAKLRLLELERVDVKSWCGFVLIGT